MTIELDHTIVSSRNAAQSARRHAELLDGHQWEILTVSYARQPG